jgi:eukaryotic-like serine/threonine-protein kinase
MPNDAKAAVVSRIGRYHITGEIGRGGMGVVYRGEDGLIGREVAIKTLTEATPELRERFYVEARSGILNHPNIVTVYELGEHEGNPFIAMEFLPGESLEKLLRQRGRLPVLESISIVEQICTGLGYAHTHGLLHRDVKPANVIVLPDGRVKIVDFGIARLADQNTRLTKTDALLGTFHYIAPERLKGEASDGRADIWSAGIILYEMVSGALPFRGKDVSTLYRVMHEPFPPITQVVEDAPEELTAVLDRALAKEMKDRYATAEEMAFDLQALAESLKRVHLTELLDAARRLSGEQQFASARTVLLRAQRIDPANTTARMLMQEVQEQLNQLQRGEQIRQLIEQAEAALTARQFDDAITLYSQAASLDVENLQSLAEQVEDAKARKAQALHVRSLWEQANEARSRGDLTRAQEFLERALQINQQSTDLRNAYAIVLREIRKRQQERKVEDLLRAARDNYSAQNYTEAMTRLREAAEIDPTHGEVQELLISVAAVQKEGRRRALLGQILKEIQESVDAENFEQAQDRVNRALDSLPAEAGLLRLKTEIEEKRRQHEAQRLVHTAALRAGQAVEDPLHALAIIQEALEHAPGDSSLLEFQSRLEEQIERARKEEQRFRLLKQAQDDLHAARYEKAIRGLESFLVEWGSSPDAETLLEHARREQQMDAERQQREAIRGQSQQLMRAGGYAAVVALLEPLVSEKKDDFFAALLEEAKSNLQEREERIQVVLSRVRGRSERDPAGAMHLLGEQPQEVLSDARVRDLREALTRRTAMLDAIQQAVKRCEDQLAAGKLSTCLNEFAIAARTYGESSELTQAREQCEQKRQTAANAALQESVRLARGILQQGKRKQALKALTRNRQAVSFASEAVRTEYEQAREQIGKGPERKTPGATNPRLRVWLVSSLALLLAAALGLGAWHGRRHATPGKAPLPRQSDPAAVPAAISTVYMDINASPWATVAGIRTAAGKDVDLKGENRATPMRVDGISAGDYVVTLQGPDHEQQIFHCQIGATQHMCTADMGGPNPDQLLRQALAGGGS